MWRPRMSDNGPRWRVSTASRVKSLGTATTTVWPTTPTGQVRARIARWWGVTSGPLTSTSTSGQIACRSVIQVPSTNKQSTKHVRRRGNDSQRHPQPVDKPRLPGTAPKVVFPGISPVRCDLSRTIPSTVKVNFHSPVTRAFTSACRPGKPDDTAYGDRLFAQIGPSDDVGSGCWDGLTGDGQVREEFGGGCAVGMASIRGCAATHPSGVGAGPLLTHRGGAAAATHPSEGWGCDQFGVRLTSGLTHMALGPYRRGCLLAPIDPFSPGA